MERADVLIVGGGPAGSACARALVQAGRDVLLVDAEVFPRDKPCAGWITPDAVRELPFSIEAYAQDHVVQPITRFRVGRIGGRAVDVDYGAPVSFGIRRFELDAELLRRSGARVLEGERIRTVERRDGTWVLNGFLAAPVLVGAGGHRCPVARHLGAPGDDASLVVARELEFLLSEGDASRCAVEEDRPELYFCGDLRGYGWCFRKADYLNVGLGRMDSRRLPAHLESFLEFLRRRNRIRAIPREGWRGHAYRVRRGAPRRIAGDALVLVGDAAGLAASASGEGILAALVSGRLAAEAVVDARLSDYPERLENGLGPRPPARPLIDRISGSLGSALLPVPGFARRVVLDRWFLHRVPAGRRRTTAIPPGPFQSTGQGISRPENFPA